ncbi:hypothetical protein SAMN05421684_2726 [Asanoa ishikariensis]|uniref:Uncharacterized protein n=1 Tax=Asanoa ishikariensis TaxID=137265 RepID=A0A1H3PAL1_9ACTN|nr:hypothetical protein [Asanoa ishikariensis]SDY98174.1 hypothetical protein SAMN05421684_2726 [Asanoa ishikariensis]
MLRLIGYWDGPEARDEGWPDVRGFVDPTLEAAEREMLVAYLRSGTHFVACAGFSLCRFCGASNGSSEQTDGEHFVWPEGLAHYVEAHGVGLPQEVRAVAARGPAAPLDAAGLELMESEDLDGDEAWWRGHVRT